MTVEEIRAVLANPVAWQEVLERVSSADCGCTHCEDVRRAIASYCEERARTLAQALVDEQSSRWDEPVSRGRGGAPPSPPASLTGSSEPDGSQRKGTP